VLAAGLCEVVLVIMDLNVGHGLVLSSFLLLLLGSYATLFSAFYPVTGIWVSNMVMSFPAWGAELVFSNADIRHTRTGHALQVLVYHAHSHYNILCHCQLGWLAVLSQFVASGTGDNHKANRCNDTKWVQYTLQQTNNARETIQKLVPNPILTLLYHQANHEVVRLEVDSTVYSAYH
jgi:hypothetical protein